MAGIAREAMSVCQCGHSGDGPGSQHGARFAEGHGACEVAGCGCAQFTWVAWTPYGRKLRDRMVRKRRAP